MQNPCLQSGDAGVPAMISTSGSDEFVQHGASGAASSCIMASANAVADADGKEDVWHLRGLSTNPAATEKLTQTDVTPIMTLRGYVCLCQ